MFLKLRTVEDIMRFHKEFFPERPLTIDLRLPFGQTIEVLDDNASVVGVEDCYTYFAPYAHTEAYIPKSWFHDAH